MVAFALTDPHTPSSPGLESQRFQIFQWKFHVAMFIDSALLRESVNIAKLNTVDWTHPDLAHHVTLYWKKNIHKKLTFMFLFSPWWLAKCQAITAWRSTMSPGPTSLQRPASPPTIRPSRPAGWPSARRFQGSHRLTTCTGRVQLKR